ncbi:MAG: ATP-binding protein [Polyangiales bacterium]
MTDDLEARIAHLEAELVARGRTISALSERVEGTFRGGASAFAVFEQNALLERLVAERTRELQAKHNELTRALDELRQAQAQLVQAQKLEAIGALAAGIAHEINTSTQYVSDNVSFLRRAFDIVLPVVAAARGAVAGEGQDALRAALQHPRMDYVLRQIPRSLEQSDDGLTRIAKIVGALKEFAHPNSSQRELLNLHQLVQSTVTVARGEWKYLAEVEVVAEPDLPPVLGLRYELSQVLLNMIVNAVHAIADRCHDEGAPKGRITIGIARGPAESVVLQVSDTGTGIAPEHRSRIFDPFFTTKPVGRGTGQGLAIAYDIIVNRHHGTITVDSEVGVGTTFSIHLPSSLRGESTP